MVPATEFPGFDSRAWFAGWLREPVRALGGVRPIELLDTSDWQKTVSTVLAQMQSRAELTLGSLKWGHERDGCPLLSMSTARLTQCTTRFTCCGL